MGRNLLLGLGGTGTVLALNLTRTAFLARTISVADLGRVFIVVNLFALLNFVFDVRINDVLYRFLPRFREADDPRLVGGLLLLCTGISSAVAVLAGGLVLGLAGVLATHAYGDPQLEVPFRLFAVASVPYFFSNLFTALLRLEDRFAAVVVPQAAGAAASLGVVVGTYFLSPARYGLPLIVGAFGLGVVVHTVPPLVATARIAVASLEGISAREALRSLRPHRRELRSTLLQTNIAGYLKLGTETGGVFLLGLFGTPTQVGLFGIARQFAQPFKILQNNLHAAAGPEVVTLWARRRFRELDELVSRLRRSTVAIGLPMFAALLAAAPWLVTLYAGREYLDAVPALYALVAAALLTLVDLPFHPLAIAMDRLARRNVVLTLRFAYIVGVLLVGLTATSLAIALLLGAVTVVLLNDVPLRRELRRAANGVDVVPVAPHPVEAGLLPPQPDSVEE